MVEVKVVRAFCDKDTSNFVQPGDILSKSQKRADELIEGGFVEQPIKGEAKPEPAKAKPSTKEEKKFD